MGTRIPVAPISLPLHVDHSSEILCGRLEMEPAVITITATAGMVSSLPCLLWKLKLCPSRVKDKAQSYKMATIQPHTRQKTIKIQQHLDG